MKLKAFFEENPTVAVAFSGGVDSAYLLYLAKRYARKVKAYYVKTAFQPQFELEDARKLAKMLDAEMEELYLDILCKPEVAQNPQNRCYYCKKTLFTAIRQAAAADGFTVLLDGTNASDDASDRPGMKALEELQVRSPLREWGMTKEEVRKASKAAELFTWDKPAYACLATRIPSGEMITADKLARTEQAETALAQLGLQDFRVRMYRGGAKLQVRERDFSFVLENRVRILDILHKYYDHAVLDLEVRK